MQQREAQQHERSHPVYRCYAGDWVSGWGTSCVIVLVIHVVCWLWGALLYRQQCLLWVWVPPSLWQRECWRIGSSRTRLCNPVVQLFWEIYVHIFIYIKEVYLSATLWESRRSPLLQHQRQLWHRRSRASNCMMINSCCSTQRTKQRGQTLTPALM